MNILKLIISLIALTVLLQAHNIDLNKSKHINQDSILELFPTPASKGVLPHVDLKFTFKVELDEKRIKHSSFKLRKIDTKRKNRIKGNVKYISSKKQLIFTPKEFLQPGIYELSLKNIKANKHNKHRKIKNINYRFSVAGVAVESLTTDPSPIDLKLDSNITFQTMINYSNSLSSIVEPDTCSVEDTTIVSVKNQTITSLSEGSTTLTCKYKSLTTTKITVNVFLEINGHRLPPEPDEELNNSTLLGIDVNNNDVRDDVERWIYKTYKDKHPIHIDITMQNARGFKKALENPEKAREIRTVVNAAMYCAFYYQYTAKWFNDSILVTEDISSKYFERKIYFNTDERYDTYRYYNSLLSGGVYTLPEMEARKNYCDFNTSKYEE